MTKGGDDDELAENWSKWKKRFENFTILAEIETQSEAYKLATAVKHCIDNEGLQILKMLNFIENDCKYECKM